MSDLAGVLSKRGAELGFRAQFAQFLASNFAGESYEFYDAVESFERDVAGPTIPRI